MDFTSFILKALKITIYIAASFHNLVQMIYLMEVYTLVKQLNLLVNQAVENLRYRYSGYMKMQMLRQIMDYWKKNLVVVYGQIYYVQDYYVYCECIYLFQQSVKNFQIAFYSHCSRCNLSDPMVKSYTRSKFNILASIFYEIINYSNFNLEQICMHIAGYNALTTSNGIIYIDTCGSLQPTRINEIIKNRSNSLVSLQN